MSKLTCEKLSDVWFSEVILYSFNAIWDRKIVWFSEFWGSGVSELKFRQRKKKKNWDQLEYSVF